MTYAYRHCGYRRKTNVAECQVSGDVAQDQPLVIKRHTPVVQIQWLTHQLNEDSDGLPVGIGPQIAQ